MSATSYIGAAITGGIGAAVGAVTAATVQVLGKRGESRAHAADLVTSAAGRMVERLDEDNTHLREAVLLLTDVLDEVIPLLRVSAPPELVEKLRKAKRAAHQAI